MKKRLQIAILVLGAIIGALLMADNFAGQASTAAPPHPTTAALALAEWPQPVDLPLIVAHTELQTEPATGYPPDVAKAVATAAPPKLGPSRSDTRRAPLTTTPRTTLSGASFEACVIERESHGDPTAQNPHSTASGLFGFLDSTWEGVTGLPGAAREYSPAIQTAAFLKLYAADGRRPWAADGC